MTLLIIGFLRMLQVDGGEAAIPDAGIRISVWFIGTFFLAIGAALLFMRIKEVDGDGMVGQTRKEDE